jgi:hypothetical protein
MTVSRVSFAGSNQRLPMPWMTGHNPSGALSPRFPYVRLQGQRSNFLIVLFVACFFRFFDMLFEFIPLLSPIDEHYCFTFFRALLSLFLVSPMFEVSGPLTRNV